MVVLQKVVPRKETLTSKIRLVVDGGKEIFDVTLGHPLVIGRNAEGNRVAVDLAPHEGQDRGVSRRHATLAPLDGQILVQDLRSANGTRLNYERLEPMRSYPLQNGDVLTLGNIRMVVWLID